VVGGPGAEIAGVGGVGGREMVHDGESCVNYNDFQGVAAANPRACPKFCVRDITNAKEACYAEQSQTD
jgi:hypothetical protein